MRKVLHIPEKITAAWLDDAVKNGEAATPDGRILPVRKMPPLYENEEVKKLQDEFSSESSDNLIVYHGSNPEALPGILKYGLFALPDRPVFSKEFILAPFATAKIRESKTGYGIITVWKIPSNLLERTGDNWDKNWSVPIPVFEGNREDLPVRDILKEADDLRYAKPEYLVGLIVVDAYGSG